MMCHGGGGMGNLLRLLALDGWMVSLFSLLCYVLLNFAACLLYFILFSVFCQAL